MFEFTDLKQTRFYQEAFAEGREEGEQRAKRNFVNRLASRGESLEDIAQLVDLPLEVVQQIVQAIEDKSPPGVLTSASHLVL